MPAAAPAFAAAYTIDHDRVRLSTRRPVTVQDCTVTRAVAPHNHDFVEVALVLAGEAGHRTAAETHRVRAGDVLVVPPGAVHAFDRPSGLRVLNVYHLSEWLLRDLRLLQESPAAVRLFAGSTLFRRRAIAHCWRPPGDVVRRLRRELDDLAAAQSPLLLRATLLKVLGLLAEDWRQWQPAEPDLRVETAAVLREVERVLAAGETLRLDALAGRIGCTAGHVTRVFRRDVGDSPREYFQRRRVQVAAADLLHGEATIPAVAARLGFSDAAHLTRHFGRQLGTTPAAYRRRFAAAP